MHIQDASESFVVIEKGASSDRQPARTEQYIRAG